ncbi:MAG: hypothetical protein ACXAD7_20110, partial [Candidatus Kariarchaeaceae archaeon]
SANVTLEILDYVNFIRWYEGSPYQARYSQINLNSANNIPAFNISASDTLDILYWKVSNDQVDSATYDLTVNAFETVSSGMTHTALHEASHAMGMSHPHDGFSWRWYNDNQYYCNNQNDTYGFYDSCNGEYAYWLWDQSSTYMSYATQPHGMSVLDKMAMQRGTGYQYLQDFKSDYDNYLDEIFSRHEYLPEPLVPYIDQAKILYDEALSLFVSGDYNDTITKVFSAREQLYASKQLNDQEPLSFDLVITGLDGIALDEYVNVTVESGSTISSYQVGENTMLTIQFTSWANVTISISYQGAVFHELQTKTWLNAAFIVDATTIPTLEISTTVLITTTTEETIYTTTDVVSGPTTTEETTYTTTDVATDTTTTTVVSEKISTVTSTVTTTSMIRDTPTESNGGDSPFPASLFIAAFILLPLLRRVRKKL